MPCLWHVLCLICGMFYGLNWKDIVVGGKGLFLGWFLVKMACTRAAKEFSGTQLRRSHAIAWLGFKMQLSSTQLRGFPRNCVAPAHFQTSNFKRPYLSSSNFDSHILGLYGNLFESRI